MLPQASCPPRPTSCALLEAPSPPPAKAAFFSDGGELSKGAVAELLVSNERMRTDLSQTISGLERTIEKQFAEQRAINQKELADLRQSITRIEYLGAFAFIGLLYNTSAPGTPFSQVLSYLSTALSLRRS